MTEPIARTVLIVGGGLAGIACAAALAQLPNVRVILLEARHALGGRAGSFEDPETGELLDNCQHVLLGCCTNLLDLYTRLGVRDKITFHRSVHFVDAAGRRHDLSGINTLPAPLHLGPSMAFFSALHFGERIAVARAMLAMIRLGRDGRNALEGISFGEWLDEHRQSPEVIRKFYDPIVVSALNEETRRASAKYAIQVFQEAMLAHRSGYVVGLPNCPLGELYAKLPPNVDVRLNTRVEEVLWQAPDSTAADTTQAATSCRATGVRIRGGDTTATGAGQTSGGGNGGRNAGGISGHNGAGNSEGNAGDNRAGSGNDILHADAIVLATNHHAVQRWLATAPAAALQKDGRAHGLAALESVPILGAHLWFDRPVMNIAAAALIEGPLQWLFRKDAAGHAVHGVISAARAWPAVPKDQALRQFETQIRAQFPAARDAKLLRGLIVIEKRATFAPLPNTEHLRPHQAPPSASSSPSSSAVAPSSSAPGLRNLFLAGDYTRTDWPATMEGAVRSGYLAAEAVAVSLQLFPAQSQAAVINGIADQADIPANLVVRPAARWLQSNLPIEWPARWLGL